MKADISEFSFGFALTHELVAHYGYAAAPDFTTLREEGHVGGHDVRLRGGGRPVFLQFKLSDYLTRKSALAASLLGVPHYRAQLRPIRYSNQHNLLLDLERKGHLVFYAAPMFYQPSELDDAFRVRNVVARSGFFRPLDIGTLRDDGAHSLSFVATHRTAYLLSEPRRLERFDGITLFREYAAKSGAGSQQQLQGDTAERALSDLIATLAHFRAPIEVLDSAIERVSDSGDKRQQLAYLSRVYLGAEVVFS